MTAFWLLMACAGKRISDPVHLYETGRRDQALQEQKQLAATPSRQQTLEHLRLGSMALATGDQDLAEVALRNAVAGMQSFEADGEWAALIGAERRKEWKGEPYEKMAAFLTLGVLLQAEGDHGNALAMYKSAILADTGSAEERFRSDFVPAWVLQALAYQAVGEDSNARASMERGIDSLYSRELLEVLDVTLKRARTTLDRDLESKARILLRSAMSAGVWAKPRDAVDAVGATLNMATSLSAQQSHKRRRDRLPGLERFSKRDFEKAREAMGDLTQAWLDETEAIEDRRWQAVQAQTEALAGLLDAPPNVVLVVEQGVGPRKVSGGRYNEVLTITRGGPAPGKLTVEGDLSAIALDDLTWQAQTRGGRRIDGFLKGKAVYKDTSLLSGYTLLRAAEIAAWRDNDQTATVLAIIGGVLFVSGAATNPQADLRQWGMAPERWTLVVGNLAPGLHHATIAGREVTLSVPSEGDLVALIPALHPKGPSHIEARP